MIDKDTTRQDALRELHMRAITHSSEVDYLFQILNLALFVKDREARTELETLAGIRDFIENRIADKAGYLGNQQRKKWEEIATELSMSKSTAHRKYSSRFAGGIHK